MYPEFRYRAPPPSYATAMQDHCHELRDIESMPYTPGSPPPSYKSHTTIERPGIHIIFPRNDEFPSSNPPTYRLRNPPSRPSLAILNDSNASTDTQLTPSRFSVTSTSALVEPRQHSEPSPPSGIVNMSFDECEYIADQAGTEPMNPYPASGTASRPNTTDGAVQTDDVFQSLSHSVAIVLEDENASTL